ncbi:TIR domain-containing protein [Amycolatopsis sp. NPDC098790]|uniref:TIR domain-containing protein n=1 Tax=Amycolatopsis sp. NPDC098790 TaxID=3363939 RepID=UPI003823596B
MSFAGAQRSLAKQFAHECESLGLSVFFDENVTEDMWGRDFITEFRRVYGGGLARYVVPFFSAEYFDSAYPMDELYAAIAHGIQREEDAYVLPVTVGDVQIPENLVRPSIGYLRSENYSVERLAQIAVKRVSGSTGSSPTPAPTPIAAARLPRVAPTDFSQFRTLESGLVSLGERFRQDESSLARFGYTCYARTADSSLEVRVEKHGRQVYGLQVRLDRDRLTVSHGWPGPSGGGINAWATAEWDAEADEGRFRFSAFGHKTQDRLLTADGLFDELWQNIIEHIEQTHGRGA